jgi:hypothetical protein
MATKKWRNLYRFHQGSGNLLEFMSLLVLMNRVGNILQKISSRLPSPRRRWIPEHVRGTRGSSDTVESQRDDGSQWTQQSRAYSPDYQSEGLEAGEEYDPESDRFSPSRAYRHYSSTQRAAAPVSSQYSLAQRGYTSVPSRYSPSTRRVIDPTPCPFPSLPSSGYGYPDIFQLERELREERYRRSELEGQFHQYRNGYHELEQRLSKLERDHRCNRTMLLLQLTLLKAVEEAIRKSWYSKTVNKAEEKNKRDLFVTKKITNWG